MDPVIGMQVLGVRAARVRAMTVLTQQQGPVLPVGDQPMRSPDVEHMRPAVVDHGADPTLAQQPLHHPVRKTRPTRNPRIRTGRDRRNTRVAFSRTCALTIRVTRIVGLAFSARDRHIVRVARHIARVAFS